jgi:flavodoxin
MRALVVYESLFGNTEKVARAVGEGLGKVPGVEVTVADVHGARPEYAERFDLVVFGMTRPATRADAEKQGAAHQEPDLGIREWLRRLPHDLSELRVATFDTRAKQARWTPGSAARSANRVARRARMRAVAHPESFYVEDVAGPLVAGERERAVDWGQQLGAGVPAGR